MDHCKKFQKFFPTVVILALLFTAGCQSPSKPQTLPEKPLALRPFTPKENYIINHGAEDGEDNFILSWNKAVIETPSLNLYRETQDPRSGRASLAIYNTHEYEKIVTNSWYQDILNFPAGQTVRLSAYIRAEAAQQAFVTIECIAADAAVLASADTDHITHDQKDWVLVLSEPLNIPRQTHLLRTRASLTGTGTAWFDDLMLAEFQPPPKMVIDDHLKDAVDAKIIKAYPVNKDSLIMAYLPEWSNSRTDHLSVADCYGGARALFDWPQIEQKYLENPKYHLVLALYSRQTTYNPPFTKLRAYEILENWPEITSWQREPQTAESYFAEFELTDGNDWKFFDVTSLLRRQANTGRENHGIKLRFAQENNPQWSGYKFVSRESKPDLVHLRPKLLVITKD